MHRDRKVDSWLPGAGRGKKECRGEAGEGTVSWCGISFWGDRDVIEFDSCDDRTTS